MAKRFTDTEKWKRPWFNNLSLQARFFWLYLLDSCDNRGIWIADYKLASFQVDYKVTEQDLLNWFGEKLIKIYDDKFLIPSFIEFQYGVLNENNNAHRPIIKLLNELNIPTTRSSLGASEGLVRSSLGALRRAQDMVLDKDKDKDKEKEGDWGRKILDAPQYKSDCEKFEDRLNIDQSTSDEILSVLKVYKLTFGINDRAMITSFFKSGKALDEFIKEKLNQDPRNAEKPIHLLRGFISEQIRIEVGIR